MSEKSLAKPIAITGSAGWLGRALIFRILNDADNLGISQAHLLVHSESEESLLRQTLPQHSSFKITMTVGDVTSRTNMFRWFSSISEPFDLIHTAGIIHPKKISDLFAVNHLGTQNVMQAALENGANRVVHVSSNSPFGNNPYPQDVFRGHEPYNPYMGYGESKMLGELAVADAVSAGLQAVIVRPPWFYGPFQPARQTTFFSMIKSGRFPIFGDGSQRRSMVFIENLVDGTLAARAWRGEPGRGWWIADTSPYPIQQIVATVGQALRDHGHTVKENKLRLPLILGRVAQTADTLIQRTGRYVQQVHVLGEMDKTIACDIGSAQEDLGYDPQVSLYEGMSRSIAWCGAQGIEL